MHFVGIFLVPDLQSSIAAIFTQTTNHLQLHRARALGYFHLLAGLCLSIPQVWWIGQKIPITPIMAAAVENDPQHVFTAHALFVLHRVLLQVRF